MLKIKSMLLLMVVCFGLPVALAEAGDELDRSALERQMEEAERQLEAATSKIAELSRALSRDEVMTYFGGMGERKPRAMLGITIGEPQNPNDGVLVTGLSPAGPASEAGLESGDIIVGINGKDLGDLPANKTARALLDELAALSPGEVARLQVRRGDRVLPIEVVTEDLSSAMPQFKMKFGDSNFRIDQDMQGLIEGLSERAQVHGDANVVIEMHGMEALKDLPARLEAGLSNLDGFPGIAMLGGPLFGLRLDLVPVASDLGAYFGVDSGLLLTATPEEDLGLKAGDIILSVDGKSVTTKSDVHRRLMTAEVGEVMTFSIVRQRESLEVDVTMPATSTMGDWTCTSSADGDGRKCVKKNGKAYQFRYSDKD